MMYNYHSFHESGEGSIFNTQLRIGDVPDAREGWIYLIHALGTSRYKIGRSVNPVARYETLKKQSPYPLQILDSFWTVDTFTDETYLHQNWSAYRVHGEWFELPKHHKSLFQASNTPLYASLTRWRLLRSSELFLNKLLEAQGFINTTTTSLITLYDSAKSREDFAYIDNIIYTTIPNQLFEFIEVADTKTPLFLTGFWAGVGLKLSAQIENEGEENDG